jgi:hypothetical protein
MDESMHWLLSIVALVLWAFTVVGVYIFLVKPHMRELDEMTPEERAKILETRRQREAKLTRMGL